MSRAKIKHVGVHAHRLQIERENPEEVEFSKEWQHQNETGNVLAYLLDASETQRNPPTPSDRDITVAATVIQWLGSPVGRSFLQGLGYEKK